ncbi:[histone H3]-lysine(4) N-trimethyltransferase [Salvia divinorum]|uniref:[histone H3]-lysine(4) N-trimethyltransferase n=1 Tax=Salvia divinorum TaxID=28513 RepID=A0ABD1GS55_SALDI
MEEPHCRKINHRQTGEAFSHCTAIVIPYLNPIELASISSTCKTLHHISTTVTSRRTSDASRGFEKLPVPFHNPIPGDPHTYSYFLYTPSQTLRSTTHFRQPWGSDHHAPPNPSYPFLFRVDGATGCDCTKGCGGDDSCPCLNLECGPSCKCDSVCGNRATQCGVTARLKIINHEKKGWGLYAAELISAGRFICEYAGEVLSTKEARERQQNYDETARIERLSPALLVVKEHLPFGNTCMRMNIDATRIGNIARFINHSCDGGNLDTLIVRSSGSLLPRVCFFAASDIQEDDELTFSYGDVALSSDPRPCFCGASSCTGILPSEHT